MHTHRAAQIREGILMSRAPKRTRDAWLERTSRFSLQFEAYTEAMLRWAKRELTIVKLTNKVNKAMHVEIKMSIDEMQAKQAAIQRSARKVAGRIL